MSPPDNTPALCRKLAQLLTVWREIEAGKNPIWENLPSLPGWSNSTATLQAKLGNLKDDVNPLLKELRTFNLITTRLAAVGSERFHERNHASWDAMADFIANTHGKYFEPEGTRETTINTMIERCQVIGHKSGLPFALWQVISAEPHTSGQAATAVGCSPGDASKALSKLVDCGLAHAPIHKGQFRIYRGIDGLTFLQDARKLVDAGIIKL